jgi:hypothetical protein
MKMSLIMVWAALTVPVVAQVNDEGVARNRARASLVVHAAAVQIIEETERLSSLTVDGESTLVSGLARAMVEQPERHRNADESRHQTMESIAQVQYDRVLGVISQAVVFARQQSPLPVTEEQVLSKAGTNARQLSEQSMSAWKTNGMDRIFLEARRQAVDEQRRRLDGQLQYPAQEALDALLVELCKGMKDPAARVSPDAWSRVSDQLGHATNDREASVLFEENERFLRATSTRMSEAIRQQYEGQVNALDESSTRDQLPGNAITSDALNLQLHDRVERAVEQITPEAGAPRYRMMAPVRSNVAARATALEESLLTDFVSSRADVAVSADQIVSLVRATPVVYRAIKSSQPIAVGEVSAGLIPSVARSYVDQRGDAAVVSRMELLLAGDRPAGAALRKRVQNNVENVWLEARERVATAQASEFFPGLDVDVPLSADQAERGCDSFSPFPAGFAELVMALRACDPDWVSWQDQPLIEETEVWVTKTARERMELACGAVEHQLKLVRAMEGEKLEELHQDVAADRPFHSILKEWSDDLTDRWSKAGGPGPEVYPDLFPRTVDLLNKTVRQLYDARRQEQQEVRQEISKRAGTETSSDQVSDAPVDQRQDDFQANSTDQEKKDDDQKQPDAPEPKKLEGMGAVEYVWKTEPDAVLIVRDTRWRRAQVVLMDAEQRVLSSATFRPDRIDDAAREIYALITPALNQALDDRKMGWNQAVSGEGEPGPQLKIFLFIQSREIRHLTSLRLRHLMQQQVDAWSVANRPGLPPVNLVWIVGL